MNPKIVKIDAETGKIKAKISELQARLRELARQKIELENTEIVVLLRGVDATPQELAAFIRAFREQKGAPLISPKQEESDHE